jgi:signal transduction histidine kinase
MSDLSSESQNPKPLGTSLILCAVLAVVVCYLRLFVYRTSPVGVGYSLPIVIVGWTRRRRLLWAMCAVFAAMASTKFFLTLHTSELPEYQRILSIALLMLDLVVIAAITDVVIRREGALRSRGRELYRREQELKMSNEGLIERQETTEILLKLSRSLTVGQGRQEIVNAIAGTIKQLLGETTAVAIWQKRGEAVEMIGHHGFGKGGPETVSEPREGSFAGLVMSQSRYAAISSMGQRTDVRPQKSRDGVTYQAMLGSALKSGSESAGALVVYSPQARSWTESDQSLVQSLAAQASVSLAATDLIGQIEDEHRELQTIVDAVPFGIMRTNASATRLVCNPTAAALLGLPEVIEADAENWPKITMIGPNGQVAPGRDPLLRALRGEVTAVTELDLVVENGETLTMLCNAAPIRNRSGAICGAISAFVDVSILKSLREEVAAHQRAQDESSLRRARFLSAVSHDIRTPANAIGLLSELLRRTAADPAQFSELPELAREIEQASQSLIGLVSDALDLTRLDLVRPELSDTEIELRKWMEELNRQLEAAVKKKNLKYVYIPPDCDVYLKIDKARLSRVMTLLIGNAVRFTESGEVRVEINLLHDGSLRFEVSDTGIGISPEEMPTLFDELVQVKSPHRAKFGGTGLALPIAQRILSLLGSKLEVSSDAGRGSTLSFILPPSKVIGEPA